MSTDLEIPKPEYWEAAVAHLMRRDRILKKIIPQHPEVWLTSRGTPFVTLARAIIGQQISPKAADAVWTKFIDAVGKRP
ncbi:DNA-3-methyladenine glycosylase 2 family protein, partial [Achromobacter denitrificans]|nr:DNA-3-methyladenine glycosylase 2 family protein [Achromobacter denitrificans]